MAAVSIRNSTLFADANLVSYWEMEGNSNDSKDSNNGSDTTIVYNTLYGKFLQGALLVSVTSSKIAFTDASNLKPTGNFSVGAWIKTSTNGYQTIIQSWNQSVDIAGVQFRVDGTTGYLHFILGRNTGTTADVDYKEFTNAVAVNDNAWHWVVAVYDGAKMYIYLDGSESASVNWTSGAGYEATNYPRIGSRGHDATDDNFFNGNIDDAFLFNRALSATEVTNHWSGADSLSAGGATGFMTTNTLFWGT